MNIYWQTSGTPPVGIFKAMHLLKMKETNKKLSNQCVKNNGIRPAIEIFLFDMSGL